MCCIAPRRFSVACQNQSLAFVCKLLLFSSGLGLPAAAFLTCLKQNERCFESLSTRLLFSLRGFHQAIIRWKKTSLVSKCNLAEPEANRSRFSIQSLENVAGNTSWNTINRIMYWGISELYSLLVHENVKLARNWSQWWNGRCDCPKWKK